MSIWLLVLIFATDQGPQGHVYAKYDSYAVCAALADQFNRDGGKVAACVQWNK
jgi:hypothetical protein